MRIQFDVSYLDLVEICWSKKESSKIHQNYQKKCIKTLFILISLSWFYQEIVHFWINKFFCWSWCFKIPDQEIGWFYSEFLTLIKFMTIFRHVWYAYFSNKTFSPFILYRETVFYFYFLNVELPSYMLKLYPCLSWLASWTPSVSILVI